MCVWRAIRDLWELGLWARDPYSTQLRLVLYGSLDHTPRSHKSRIELQTHIIYYVAVDCRATMQQRLIRIDVIF